MVFSGGSTCNLWNRYWENLGCAGQGLEGIRKMDVCSFSVCGCIVLFFSLGGIDIFDVRFVGIVNSFLHILLRESNRYQ